MECGILTVVTTADVVVVVETTTELEIDEVVVVALELLDEDDTRADNLYNSSLSPAPQYWYWLPGHMKLQSASGVMTDVAPRVLPQKPV